MDILWIVIALLVLATCVTLLVRDVRDDGLGHREPPRSHTQDTVPVTQVFSR